MHLVLTLPPGVGGRPPRDAAVGSRTLSRPSRAAPLLAYGITPLGQVAVPEFLDVTAGIVAINSSAEVAATGSSGSSGEAYFLNTNGQATWLRHSRAPRSRGDRGERLGRGRRQVFNSRRWEADAIREAVLYNSQGQATGLGNLGGSSQATGINGSGQVVGDSATWTAYNSPTHAFLYNQSGPPIDLGRWAGP